MKQRTALILQNDEYGWAAVRAALQDQNEVEVIGAAQTGDDVRQIAAKQQIDLLLASDILAAGTSSKSILTELRATTCRSSMIALFVSTSEPDELEQFGQLELAASCWWRDLHTVEAIAAILTAILTNDLLVCTRNAARGFCYNAYCATSEDHQPAWLRPLDREILSLHAEGFSAKEIAPRVSRAPHTVHNRLCELRSKLGARNGPHLVHLAHRLCLIQPTDTEALSY